MTHTDIQQVLDWAVAEVGIPGIVVEARDGDRSWFGSAGVADLRTGAPRQPGEHAQIGSGGKAFMAAVLLDMEAEGRLSIDDPVNRWLPGVLDVNGYDGDRITVRHLLSNTGGLYATGLAPELTSRYGTRAAFLKHRFDEYTTEDLFRMTVSQPPVAEPGERFLYANGGFYLAEAMIEKITGNSFAEEVERRVFRPLGLAHTYVRPAGELGYRDPHPRAYSNQFFQDGVDMASVTGENWPTLLEEPGLEPLDVTEFNTSWLPGNIVSTTSDMIRAVSALASGALLPPDQHREMWTTVSTEGADWLPHTRYGLGLFEFDKAVTGDQTLRGVGGSYWGTMFFTVSTADGEHAISVHTNIELKSWEVLRRIFEAGFGVSIGA
ncbi:D-alanyl-D-alanine carboxypeptidase [Streptoalloteichus tenebrarius]|uniref:D-alanyl-D-alanine carboxypeptidase n=1 Tax=Streptoalloteichus tenebrarius (strain ATCC 17920 / DSM 40477 / JCM 4838 / CBS 697.72 / NBRC 16177 / NCIMB 11028 / NRRL B-12390 / A12253. 1 / ISP 5477) TaxID=1933 RepID=A0ABT1I0Y8_STRSD|nr:serine hydrolase domain-containing protein [Streptoalloteichus tenebrarius]MCP2261415.1 D-alanyl-D-alanine carboxypeptidase [Streptoalloteichus tenebrarius]BFF02019.1 serine hydrolase domain-containing protein [Streptoalloteichus tenebrarius]